MLKRLLTMLLVLGTLLVSMNAYAASVTYTVDYAKDSKYKALSLKNATLRIQVYLNGTPKGFLTKKTDDKGTFSLENKQSKYFVIVVISIEGKPKNIYCSGASKKGKTEILINCRPR